MHGNLIVNSSGTYICFIESSKLSFPLVYSHIYFSTNNDVYFSPILHFLLMYGYFSSSLLFVSLYVYDFDYFDIYTSKWNCISNFLEFTKNGPRFNLPEPCKIHVQLLVRIYITWLTYAVSTASVLLGCLLCLMERLQQQNPVGPCDRQVALTFL